MKFQEYNPIPGCGCVVRTFSKLLEKDVSTAQKELEVIAQELGYQNINEIEVFDSYFLKNHYQKQDMSIPIRELNLKKGKYGVFCFKEDDYHMFSIIDGVVYDKNQRYLDMKTISIYKYVGK